MHRSALLALDQWKSKPDRQPLILQGARQVGKTFLLKKWGESSFSKTHYINFEKDPLVHVIFEKNLTPQRILADLALHLGTKIDIRNDLLIFDEIQECSKALTSLKYFNEEQPELAVCTAGSLLGLSLSPGSFPVGKVEFLKLYPMSFAEFLLAKGETLLLERWNQAHVQDPLPDSIHEKLWENLKIYFIVGGLPRAILTYLEKQSDPLSAFSAVRERQEDLITAYIADMAKHSGKLNSMHLERFWKNIPAQLARSQENSVRRFQFKGVIPGKNKFAQLVGTIDWLRTAGIIIQVPIVNQALSPLQAYRKESFFKLYCFDVGILGALSQLSPKVILDYNYGTYKGFFAENFVIQELLTSGCDSVFSWNEGEAEVEFLYEYGGQMIGIEVKSGQKTRSKSLKMLKKKYPSVFASVLCGKPERPLYMAGRALKYFGAELSYL